ncbi:MAG: hypothetical protein JSU73_09805 [candidate division WOR-3 bacterium]|nr:MAG: hypothetical protein JSU73_09805 [candidate division WOR-3 bacterium]
MSLEPSGPGALESSPLPKVSWSVFRARENVAKTVLVGIAIAVFLTFTLWYFGILLALVALLVLFVALHTYFLPIRYTLAEDGIILDKRIFSHTYPWDQFRAYFRTSGGIVISPFSRRTFLDSFRGVHLLLPEDPTEILTYLGHRFPVRQPKPDLDGQNGSDRNQGTA